MYPSGWRGEFAKLVGFVSGRGGSNPLTYAKLAFTASFFFYINLLLPLWEDLKRSGSCFGDCNGNRRNWTKTVRWTVFTTRPLANPLTYIFKFSTKYYFYFIINFIFSLFNFNYLIFILIYLLFTLIYLLFILII